MEWFRCWRYCWHIIVISLCVLQFSVDWVASRVISEPQQSVPDNSNRLNSRMRWKRQEKEIEKEQIVVPDTKESDPYDPPLFDSNKVEDYDASETEGSPFNSLWWSSLCGNQDDAAEHVSQGLGDHVFVLRIEHEAFDTRSGLLSGLSYTVKVEGTESGLEWVTEISGGTWWPIASNKSHLVRHCPMTFDQKRRRRRFGSEIRRTSTTATRTPNLLPGFATDTKAEDGWLIGPTRVTSFPCRIDESVDQVTFSVFWLESSGRVRGRLVTFPVLRDCQLFTLATTSHISSRHLPPSSYYRHCQIYIPLYNSPSSNDDSPRALQLQFTQLQMKSVACANGLQSGLTLTQASNFASTKSYADVIQHFNSVNTSQTQILRHYCGLLEDYPTATLLTRTYANWTILSVHMSALEDKKSGFNMSFLRVGPCDNFLWTQRTARWQLSASQGPLDVKKENKCQFRIHIPYGYQVQFKVQLLCAGHPNCSSVTTHAATISTGSSVSLPRTVGPTESENNVGCMLMELEMDDASGVTVSCLNSPKLGAAYSSKQYLSDSNILLLNLKQIDKSWPWEAVWVEYSAAVDAVLAGGCDYGWVHVEQQCMQLVNTPLIWQEAEQTCVSMGGHLAAITDQYQQDLAHDIIINSAHYDVNGGYWLGGSDRRQETVFEWTSGQSWSYSHWFPGWENYRFYNSQPSDDGDHEGQDCLEMRQTFRIPRRGQHLPTSSLYWNDRKCQALNAFLCQKPLERSVSEKNANLVSCNVTHELTRQQPAVQFSSPNYPESYPPSTSCVLQLVVPTGYFIVLSFHHFDLEYEEQCSYDYMELWEAREKSEDLDPVLRRCGNWNARLKLLRHQSRSNRLEFRFRSDSSYAASGYQVTASIERATFSCSDPRHHIFNSSCYLAITYPEVTYQTARDVCQGFQADLAQLNSPEEANFLSSKILVEEFNTTPFYWIGVSQFATPDAGSGLDECLGFEPTEVTNSAFQWHSCKALGGYFCQKSMKGLRHGIESIPILHQKVEKSEGEITSPMYPDFYPNNQHYQVVIQRPQTVDNNFLSRILFRFHHLDLEYQDDCLYDYVGLQTSSQGPMQRFCGSHNNLKKFDFVSESDQLWVTFHSDYSIAGQGFSASWTMVDLVGCPEVLLVASQGELQSPNYPHTNLPNMDCSYKLRAPEGYRVRLQIVDLDIGIEPDSKGRCREEWLQIHVTDPRPNNRTWLRLCGTAASEKLAHPRHFLSHNNQLTVRYHTTQGYLGGGFRAVYQFLAPPYEVQSELELIPEAIPVELHAINYPLPPPSSTRSLYRFYTRPGYIIQLHLRNVYRSPEGSSCLGAENSSIHVWDPSFNLSSSFFCWSDVEIDGSDRSRFSPEENVTYTSEFNSLILDYAIDSPSAIMPSAIIQVLEDPDFAEKISNSTGLVGVDGCTPNFCQNDGICVTVLGVDFHYCNCSRYWTGMFCTLTLCDRHPCVHGTCALTETNYVCSCEAGFSGKHCDMPTTPCDENPCQNHGDCLLTPDGFQCRCHAWWKGPRCETRWLHIPYKPLSQRMLEEPFWLGLITMAVVLLIIALVFCAKRHFPEKLERFVTEELDRQKQVSPTGWRRGFSAAHRASIEPILAQGHAPSSSSRPSSPLLPCNGSSLSAPTRTLLSRLNFRKPSLLSLSSAISHSAYSNAQQTTPRSGRTFSLDDLFRITRRSPSPGKRGSDNDVATAQRRDAERHQLLQRLVASRIPKPESQHITMDYLHEGREGPRRTQSDDNSTDTDSVAQLETSFGKNEKKVTFARMLSLVAAEIDSSNSDLSGADDANKAKEGSGGMTLQVTAEINPGGHSKRHRSRPWATRRTWKSPNSTSSTQGSASDLENAESPEASSSETPTPVGTRRLQSLRIPAAGKSTTPSTLTIHQGNKSLGTKASSSDSLLAMLRGLSAGMNQHRTPSTPSSPQVESDLDGGGNTSCYPTPLSTPGTPSGNTLENLSFASDQTDVNGSNASLSVQVPVFDPTSSQRFSRSNSLNVGNHGNGSSYVTLEIPSQSYGNWLSPIHEVPTPLPSPSHTPIPTLRRQQAVHVGVRSDGDESSSSSSRSDNSTVLSTQAPRAPRIFINITGEQDAELSLTPSASIPPSPASPSSPKPKPPPLVIRDSNFLRFHEPAPPPFIRIPSIPIITIEEEVPETATENDALPTISDIGVFEPEEFSDQESHKQPTVTWDTINIGSPPVKKVSSMEFSSLEHNRMPRKSLGFETRTLMECGGPSRRLLREILDKSSSLDLPTAPPLITITSNLSEVESDTEPSTMMGGSSNMPVNTTMCYLSPYAYLGNRPVEMAASESNLSSSGYSSMASPGPSPCGSSKTLCESEDLMHPLALRHQRRLQSIRALSPSLESSSPPDSPANVGHKVLPAQLNQLRHLCQPHSDSEITDDPAMAEPVEHESTVENDSNDEGIGIDPIHEKIDSGEVKSAKELESLIADLKTTDSNKDLLYVLDNCDLTDKPLNIQKSRSLDSKTTNLQRMSNLKSDSLDTKLLHNKSSFQTSLAIDILAIPPTTLTCSNSSQVSKTSGVILTDEDRKRSPVSSRSESPLSDAKNVNLGRFSKQFYGLTQRMDLPYTDSDGLYDYPSSEPKLHGIAPHRALRKSDRRRERKAYLQQQHGRSNVYETLTSSTTLDVASPGSFRRGSLLEPSSSPKRRLRFQASLDCNNTSSSSNESLSSPRFVSRKSPSSSPSRPLAKTRSPPRTLHFSTAPSMADRRRKRREPARLVSPITSCQVQLTIEAPTSAEEDSSGEQQCLHKRRQEDGALTVFSKIRQMPLTFRMSPKRQESVKRREQLALLQPLTSNDTTTLRRSPSPPSSSSSLGGETDSSDAGENSNDSLGHLAEIEDSPSPDTPTAEFSSYHSCSTYPSPSLTPIPTLTNLNSSPTL